MHCKSCSSLHYFFEGESQTLVLFNNKSLSSPCSQLASFVASYGHLFSVKNSRFLSLYQKKSFGPVLLSPCTRLAVNLIKIDMDGNGCEMCLTRGTDQQLGKDVLQTSTMNVPCNLISALRSPQGLDFPNCNRDFSVRQTYSNY